MPTTPHKNDTLNQYIDDARQPGRLVSGGYPGNKPIYGLDSHLKPTCQAAAHGDLAALGTFKPTWFQVAIQAVDWFVPEHHLCIGLRCRFCEVLSAFDHGGTQTVRFWGLQYVHWGCEGSCCCFLRLQSRLVWDVPKALHQKPTTPHKNGR